MALCGTLVYGELAARYPEAGGGYVYLREAWDPRVAFLYGWKCCLVMDPGITAALATGLAAYVGYLVPLGPIGLKVVGISARSRSAPPSTSRARVLGAVRAPALAVLKIGALATIVRAGVRPGPRRLGRTSCPSSRSIPARRRSAAALAGAFISAFFAFGGWWEASQADRRGARSGDARCPAR